MDGLVLGGGRMDVRSRGRCLGGFLGVRGWMEGCGAVTGG